MPLLHPAPPKLAPHRSTIKTGEDDGDADATGPMGVEDGDGLPLQLPKPGWQPMPQYGAVEPQ